MEKEKTLKTSKLKEFGQKTLDFINKITSTSFVTTLMESFILIMPIIITSTVFILAAELAPSFGYKWKDADGNILNQGYATFSDFCYRMYNLSYGILGLALVIAISYKLTEKISPKLQADRKMNVIIICISSVLAYMLFSVPNLWSVGAEETQTNVLWIISAIFGVKGLFISMLTGMSVPWLFLLFFKYNITIRLSKQVPQSISQSFLNIFPILFTIIIYGLLGWVFIEFTDNTMLDAVFKALTPLLEGAKSYWFFTLWSIVISFTWFVGIHPNVWYGVTGSLGPLAVAENVAAFEAGEQAVNWNADPFATGAYNMGGSGAQIAVPFIIILFCKSKQLKSIGMVAVVPILFQVNEPILFGLPTILNPIMLIPMIAAPLLNSIIGIIFILGFGMNASIIQLPWSMPIVISIPISSQFQASSFILPWVWFGVSFAVWMPFVLIQDKINYKKNYWSMTQMSLWTIEMVSNTLRMLCLIGPNI
ncbi:PTS sugar transporter subunit IIC [Spiroplasma clarkii]|uniref:PTS sugar transporter subunit IIC n=1 Tax=Spiroplasma clarkii TaxID=2139 RepID=UPI0011BADDEC|nr:PTS transporter subunit EIIC [Spiroplasma clarkii]